MWKFGGDTLNEKENVKIWLWQLNEKEDVNIWAWYTKCEGKCERNWPRYTKWKGKVAMHEGGHITIFSP